MTRELTWARRVEEANLATICKVCRKDRTICPVCAGCSRHILGISGSCEDSSLDTILVRRLDSECVEKRLLPDYIEDASRKRPSNDGPMVVSVWHSLVPLLFYSRRDCLLIMIESISRKTLNQDWRSLTGIALGD